MARRLTVIGHVLEAVDFLQVVHDVAVLFKQGDALGQFLALQDDEPGQFSGDRRRRGDFVHHQTQGRGIYKIEDVVERGSQTVDVLAIERSDEALVELGDDGVGGFVASVLDGLHLTDPHGKIAGVSEDGAEQFGSLGEIAGEFGEKIKEFGVAGD